MLDQQQDQESQAITFWEALKVDGVLAIGFSFFFVKFAAYAILLWLPSYAEKELGYDSHAKANIASFYEGGNLIGGFLLGWISDLCNGKRTPVGMVAVTISTVIGVILTIFDKSISFGFLAFSMLLLGLCLGGMHHLLCVTCAADLGQNLAK